MKISPMNKLLTVIFEIKPPRYLFFLKNKKEYNYLLKGFAVVHKGCEVCVKCMQSLITSTCQLSDYIGRFQLFF